MQPIQPQKQSQRPPLRFGANAHGVRFGASAAHLELTGLTKAGNELFKRITYDRTSEMLLEDFVGFGVLRTWMDLRRDKKQGEQKNNWPAATERLSRETLSILTDNVLAGGVAYGIGKWFDRKNSGFSNKFTDFDTLELFKELTGQVKATDSATAKKEFLAALKSKMGTIHNENAFDRILNQAWESGKNKAPKPQTTLTNLMNWAQGKEDPTTVKALNNATEFTKAINPKAESFTHKLGNQEFCLQGLLDDVSRFSQHMTEAAASQTKQGSWKTLAERSIAKTLTAKTWRIPLSLGAAMAATFTVPFVISSATKKIWKIESYPGEIAFQKKNEQLQKQQGQQKSFWERHFPYISSSLSQHKWWPLAVSLLPLPLAMGLVDTEKISIATALFKKGAVKAWLKMFDFKKLAPFTGQQQMAAVFALLITSRLLNARTDNEYRERLVDSFAGWGLWILGTPIIKRFASMVSDKMAGTTLVKTPNWNPLKVELRTKDEISKLLQAGSQLESTGVRKTLTSDILKKTYTANVRLGMISTLATIGMLGVVEPWIGIKLTQRNERKKQAKLAAQTQAKQTQALPFQSYRPQVPAFPNRPANPQPSPFNWPAAQPQSFQAYRQG